MVRIIVVEHTGFEKLTGMQDWVIRSAKRLRWCVNIDERQRDVVRRSQRIIHIHRLGITPVKLIKSNLVMTVSKHNRGSTTKT